MSELPEGLRLRAGSLTAIHEGGDTWSFHAKPSACHISFIEDFSPQDGAAILPAMMFHKDDITELWRLITKQYHRDAE